MKMAMFLDYKLKGGLGKGFFRQLHHLITLDMGMVLRGIIISWTVVNVCQLQVSTKRCV